MDRVKDRVWWLFHDLLLAVAEKRVWILTLLESSVDADLESWYSQGWGYESPCFAAATEEEFLAEAVWFEFLLCRRLCSLDLVLKIAIGQGSRYVY